MHYPATSVVTCPPKRGTPNHPLSRHVHSFFQDYLERQRDLSPNTILSYRDTLKLFLQFASKYLGKPVVTLSPEMLDVELVLVFLDYLEAQRNNSPATRNLRLAALRSFFGYVGGQDPLLLDQCRRIVDIPLKRVATPAVDYLEQEELEAVLDGIDRSTPGGRRDFVLVSLAYQTGARVQELLNLRASDLQLTPPAWVRLFGKGRKERLVPLWNQTAELLRTLLVERNITAQSSSSVFANLRGQPLTRWGFRLPARQTCPGRCSHLSEHRGETGPSSHAAAYHCRAHAPGRCRS